MKSLSNCLNIDPRFLQLTVMKQSFDQATYAVGQIISYAPVGVSKYLDCFDYMLKGMRNAIRYGWRIHHGIGKFACNSLLCMAKSEDVDDDVRKMVLDLLLDELSIWLMDDRELGVRSLSLSLSLAQSINHTHTRTYSETRTWP
jgi:hypothetical protein